MIESFFILWNEKLVENEALLGGRHVGRGIDADDSHPGSIDENDGSIIIVETVMRATVMDKWLLGNKC